MSVRKKYRIVINIGSASHFSDDGGATWENCMREMPCRNTPIIKGIATDSILPHVDNNDSLMWTEVNIAKTGIGIAVALDISVVKQTRSLFFFTSDKGKSWVEEKINIKPLFDYLKFRLFWLQWPLKELIYGTVISGKTIYIPLFDSNIEERDDSKYTHVLFTNNIGRSWGYKRIYGPGKFPYDNMLTVAGKGHVILIRDGFYVETLDDGKTWEKRIYLISRPESYEGTTEKIEKNILDDVIFADRLEGYARVTHADKKKIEVLRTIDGGNIWYHLHDFDSLYDYIHGQNHYFSFELKQK